jgi:hypothetical protein
LNPFAALITSFLAWWHDPSRILGQFDAVQRRLNASASFHERQTSSKRAVISSLQSQVQAHQQATARALTVSSKLNELVG